MTSGADEPLEPTEPLATPAATRRRVPYFERPKHPRDWRWVVGGIGKTLIVLGLLMFAFVGYQLWGTGIETARAQNSLENEFQDLLSATTTAPSTTTPPVTTAPDPATTSTSTTSTIPTAPAGPPIPDGEPIARMLVPSIGLDWYVVQGVGKDDLKKGPGHFRETPMPGQLGNAAIAGHRTTYGAPFNEIDELVPGDLIEVITPAGRFVYAVTGTVIVEPSEYAAVIPTIDPTIATLVLATCHPEYTSDQRLVVRAELVVEQSDQVMAPPSNTQPADPDATLPTEDTLPPDTVPDTTPDDTTPDDTVTATTDAPVTTTTLVDEFVEVEEDGFSGGWFDDSAAIPHALGWGLLLFAVGVGAYFVGRASNRLYVSFLVGAVPFVVVMYFFFENVNRLLPPGL
ncbi:MAG: class E sortase [Actinomycetota bacterium]|nr:class E sortase [Actinomycetota bacterium]